MTMHISTNIIYMFVQDTQAATFYAWDAAATCGSYAWVSKPSSYAHCWVRTFICIDQYCKTIYNIPPRSCLQLTIISCQPTEQLHVSGTKKSGGQLQLTVFLVLWLSPWQVSRNELKVEKLSCQLSRSESRNTRNTISGVENRTTTRAMVPNRAVFAIHSFTWQVDLDFVESAMAICVCQYKQPTHSLICVPTCTSHCIWLQEL